MTTMNNVRTYQFKALTDIWTGDANGKPNRLITTGLLGSIRWWFEVLVRGLGGKACDPSKTECEGRNHCVVCELFGCTGWARKFRFDVLDKDDKIQQDQIKASQNGENFKFRFTPLRPICDEEWALLEATLLLIADFGAIGGKTVFKPTDETNRANQLHHKDFGLIKFDSSIKITENEIALKEYVSQKQWRGVNHGEFAWASLQHFWCVKGKYLARQMNGNSSSFNRVIGRPESKQQSSQKDSWLAGRRPDPPRIEAESKKVFSFKTSERTFGFVKEKNNESWKRIKDSLDDLRQNNVPGWGNFDLINEFLMANQILENLFSSED